MCCATIAICRPTNWHSSAPSGFPFRDYARANAKSACLVLELSGSRRRRRWPRMGSRSQGWVRQPRPQGEIEIFSGREQLPAFLARSEIVVNLLPLTPETRGILNAEAFAHMPKGGAIVNLGRGA